MPKRYLDANGSFCTADKAVRVVEWEHKHRSNGNAGAAFTNPSEAGAASSAAPSEPPPRPDSGRPRTSASGQSSAARTATKKESAPLDLSVWVSIVHFGIANKTQQPHWILTDAEAAAYGKALGNVLRHIPVHISQFASDLSALCTVAWTIEKDRISQFVEISKAKKAGRTATVLPFPQTPSSVPAGPQPPQTQTSASAAAAATPAAAQEHVEGFQPETPIGGFM